MAHSPTTICVTGGAGFIGSHLVKLLSAEGHRVVTLDNLSTGVRHAARFGELEVVDVRDRYALDEVFGKFRFDAVMHLAGVSVVSHSVSDPALYDEINVNGTQNLLDVMESHGVRQLVFSSTASVYGESENEIIDERQPVLPRNPYGNSKLCAETHISRAVTAGHLNAIIFRYFNVCGADPAGDLGEEHEPETHIIPLLLRAANGGDPVTLFGREYPTPDGTPVRDYVHVEDICRAHVLALEGLASGNFDGLSIFNLGSGKGHSVCEVVNAVGRVVGSADRVLSVEEGPRRLGDVSALIADINNAREILGWTPQYADLETMIRHAWAWERRVR